MGSGLEIALFSVTTASTLYAADRASKANKEQSRANERREQLQQKRANAQTARERTKILRKQRIARAQATASTTADAGGKGSAIAGVLGNIQGQGAGNIQFLNQNQNISNQISSLNISSGRRVARFQTGANFGQAVAGVSGAAQDIFS
jgi:sRNA-binding protein